MPAASFFLGVVEPSALVRYDLEADNEEATAGVARRALEGPARAAKRSGRRSASIVEVSGCAREDVSRPDEPIGLLTVVIARKEVAKRK